MTRISFVTPFLFLLVATVYSQDSSQRTQCGEFTCPFADACCRDSFIGEVCYNTTTHHCLTSFDSTVLCASMDLKCGMRCFDPENYNCLANQRLCPKGTQLCGEACYDPTLYECRNNEQDIVPRQPEACGTQTCSGNQVCCRGNGGVENCFDPTTEVCNTFGTPCPIMENTAFEACGTRGGVRCYDPRSQFCCFLGMDSTVCTLGDSTCCPTA